MILYITLALTILLIWVFTTVRKENFYLGEYWKVKKCACPRNINIV